MVRILQLGLPGPFDGPGGIEENEVAGEVNVKDAPATSGALAKGGFGERICDSLLGEALKDGVAETRLRMLLNTSIGGGSPWKDLRGVLCHGDNIRICVSDS